MSVQHDSVSPDLQKQDGQPTEQEFQPQPGATSRFWAAGAADDPLSPTKGAFFSHNGILQLQRLIGNQSVTRLITRHRQQRRLQRQQTSTASTRRGQPRLRTGDSGVIQMKGLSDQLSDTRHNRRKVGVEVTESTAGGSNVIKQLDPLEKWQLLNEKQKRNFWETSVELPNESGSTQTWYVGKARLLIRETDGYFEGAGGAKGAWMRWGNVLLTEDTGEFEWILTHPDTPPGVTEYRSRLAEVSTARGTLRSTLQGLGLGNSLVLSRTVEGNAGEVIQIVLSDTDQASSQITFESTQRAKTKKALLEGMTHGAKRAKIRDRSKLVTADKSIVEAVDTATKLVEMGGIDMGLVVAYLMADIMHKTATITRGWEWAQGTLAGNYKNWRVLFPKSHPFQIVKQATDVELTPAALGMIRQELKSAKKDIIAVLVELIASHLSTTYVEWGRSRNVPPELTKALVPGSASPDPALLRKFVEGMFPYFFSKEFDEVVTALTDDSMTAGNVVRSTSFASHDNENKGVAFEDRAEVRTSFPDLKETYDRIVKLVDRY